MARYQTKCHSCGGRLQRGAKLCAACGQQVLQWRESEHCPGCGARMLATEGLCPICGARHVVRRSRVPRLVFSFAGGFLAVAALVGATWLLKPWSEFMVLLGPTPTATATRTVRLPVTLAPTATIVPTHTATPSPTPSAIAVAIPSPSPLTPTTVATVLPTPTKPMRLTLTAVAKGPAGPIVHVVQAGDTLGSIAVQYDSAADEIAQANNITKRTVLHIGQELVIPKPTAAASEQAMGVGGASAALPTATAEATRTPVPGTQVVHVIEQGDLLGKLAAKYGVRAEEIAAANGITVKTVLNIGQKLVIPVVAAEAEPTPMPTSTASPTLGISLVPSATLSVGLAAGRTNTSTASSDTRDIAAPTLDGSAPEMVPEEAGPSYAGIETAAAAVAPSATMTVSLEASQTQTITHVVESGDTLGSIAVRYQVSSQDIARANDISLTSTLNVGQQLIIPGVAATPTVQLTATPSSVASATPSPTPTATSTRIFTPAAHRYLAPRPLVPINGSVAKSDAPQTEAILLSWSSVGILGDDEWYQLSVWLGEESAEPIRRILSRATSYRLQRQALPAEMSSCYILWQVVVVSSLGDHETSVAISPPGPMYQFCWR